MSENKDKIQETMEILNMTCKGCARTLGNEFRKFEGIDYSVSFPNKSITVTYSSADFKRGDFEKAIETHGYTIKGKTH